MMFGTMLGHPDHQGVNSVKSSSYWAWIIPRALQCLSKVFGDETSKLQCQSKTEEDKSKIIISIWNKM